MSRSEVMTAGAYAWWPGSPKRSQIWPGFANSPHGFFRLRQVVLALLSGLFKDAADDALEGLARTAGIKSPCAHRHGWLVVLYCL